MKATTGRLSDWVVKSACGRDFDTQLQAVETTGQHGAPQVLRAAGQGKLRVMSYTGLLVRFEVRTFRAALLWTNSGTRQARLAAFFYAGLRRCKKAVICLPSITSTTEAAIRATPATSDRLKGSWNTRMPTATAVTGSITPMMDVSVEPMR